MVNQTTEILVGISNQTGMQLNELITYMASYQYTSSLLYLVMTIVGIVILVFVNYLVYKAINDEEYDDSLDDEDRLFIVLFINGLLCFAMVVIFNILIGCVLGMMYPKQAFIQQIIQSIMSC